METLQLLFTARHWYGKAIKSDHPVAVAMVGLGALEAGQGRAEQARAWYGQAIESGHPDQAPEAMLNLGILEHQQGRIEEARAWYEKARQPNHPEAGPAAQQALDELDRRAEEQRRAGHFRRYGWQAYADPDLMTNPTEHNPPNGPDPTDTASGDTDDDPPR